MHLYLFTLVHVSMVVSQSSSSMPFQETALRVAVAREGGKAESLISISIGLLGASKVSAIYFCSFLSSFGSGCDGWVKECDSKSIS